MVPMLMPTDTCEITHVHPDGVRRARAAVPSLHDAAGLAAIFDALGDPTRVRLLTALAVEPLCVCDLSAVLGMKQPAVSHQLRFLRALGLVEARRDGKMVWYSLADDHVRTLLAVGAEHVGCVLPDADARTEREATA